MFDLHHWNSNRGFSGVPPFCLGLYQDQELGVGVASVEWLPKQASNITFISGSMYRVAEFDIDRDAIKKWCDSIEKPLSPVTENQNVAIPRVNSFLEQLGITENRAIKDSSPAAEDFDPSAKRFTTGDLFYEHHWSNGGGYVIGYDVTEGRGYYHYAHN